jgi:hypothetical protein
MRASSIGCIAPDAAVKDYTTVFVRIRIAPFAYVYDNAITAYHTT